MSSPEEINAAILAKGDEIRVMKGNKASKDDIMAKVAELNDLKAQYKSATGSDWVNPAGGDSGGSSSSKKKEKKTDGKGEASGGGDNRQAAKEKRLAERMARAAAEKESAAKAKDAGISPEALDKFGDLPMVRSQAITGKVWQRVGDLSPEWAGRKVLLRGRLQTSRPVGKGIFVLLRQGICSVQGVLFQGDTVPKAFVDYVKQIPRESVIDVGGTVTVPSAPIASATQSLVELQVDEVHVVSYSQMMLPFQVEDASRPDSLEDPEMPTVNIDTRLNYRWLDTRTPANQSIFRIQSAVVTLFREFMLGRNFVEIHTPKLLAGASESGASVFALNYFDQTSCLAQSPQLYKQMACACGGFDRVFEIGPVFRAEKSFTHRHLCEFTGLDMEMAINEHYYEVMDMFSDMFIYIFDNLASRFKDELEAVNAQHPFPPLEYCRPSLRITFAEGVKLLREAGYDASPEEDLDTEKEKALGRIIKEKYHTDFYMMDQYPMSVRPFYTMPNPDNPKLSNSFDMFIRGEEILSGAQRIHDVNLLTQEIAAKGVPLESLRTYVDSFRDGALPHGGGGVGLERVVMLYLGLKNIRKASLFPRDPKRLAP